MSPHSFPARSSCFAVPCRGASQAGFCLVPESVHFLQRRFLRASPAAPERLLDESESSQEFFVRSAESVFGVDADEACVVHQCEEEVAEFLFPFCAGAAGQRQAEFLQFLAHFVPDRVGMVPVETDMRSALLNPVGALKGGEVPGNSLEQRPPSFVAFDDLPVSLHLLGPGNADVPEDVGMPPDQFGGDAVENVLHGEFPGLLGNRGLEENMKEKIAELGLEVVEAASIERFDYLIGLLDEAVPQGAVCLFAVPGAFLPESPDDANEASKIRSRDDRE